MISAMLIFKTGNIIPLIVYHFTNNTVSSITSSDVNSSFELALTLGIFLIGVVYMIYLYLLIKENGVKAEKEGAGLTNPQ